MVGDRTPANVVSPLLAFRLLLCKHGLTATLACWRHSVTVALGARPLWLALTIHRAHSRSSIGGVIQRLFRFGMMHHRWEKIIEAEAGLIRQLVGHLKLFSRDGVLIALMWHKARASPPVLLLQTAGVLRCVRRTYIIVPVCSDCSAMLICWCHGRLFDFIQVVTRIEEKRGLFASSRCGQDARVNFFNS